MHVWCAVLCMQKSIDFHRDMTQTPLQLFTLFLNLLHTHSHPIPSHTHTHPQSHNIPLAGFVLWGCGRVSSHKWISPHIPLSIKEPVCVPTAARGTPLQLFVLSDTSTCYLYLCISGYLHLTHLEATLIRFLPYFFFNPCYWIIWVILQVYGLKTINVVEDRLWTLSFSGTNIQFNSNILRAKVVLTDICNNISNILNTVFCAHLICVF